ncbi:MAG: flagellar biosynthesis anti-sigma factor FlgM [Legionella longbeachae]|nr:flagellar biosynthesis anti-sigma factor FlgM [Legionella longbeachae]
MNQTDDIELLKTIDTDNHLKTRHKAINHLEPHSIVHSINNTLKQLEAIKNSLEDIPEINEARVLYLKSEIALGNYQIDSEKIAQRMFHLEPTEL